MTAANDDGGSLYRPGMTPRDLQLAVARREGVRELARIQAELDAELASSWWGRLYLRLTRWWDRSRRRR